MKEDEIVRPSNRHSIESVTLRKHVIKYKNMRKLMVEFLRKFENRQLKVVEITRFLSPKSLNLQLFTLNLSGIGGPL